MHDEAVGRSTPRRAANGDVRRVPSGSPRVGSIRRCEPRREATVSIGCPVRGRAHPTGRCARSHGGPSESRSPACCAAVIEGNSSGALSTSPAAAGPLLRSRAGRRPRQRPPPATRAPHRRRRAPPPTRRGIGCSSEAESPADPATARLAEHRSGVPVHVPVSALPCIASPGAPRDPGDDERRRIPARWRSDPHEGVVLSGRTSARPQALHALRNGDVDLEGSDRPRTSAARNNQESRTVARSCGRTPADRCNRRESWGRSSPVRADVRGAGEHGDRRSRGGTAGSEEGPVSGSDRPRPLVEPRETIRVVGLRALDHARVVDRAPSTSRCAESANALIDGREPMQRLRRGLHSPRFSRARRVRTVSDSRGRELPRPVRLQGHCATMVRSADTL